MNTETIQTMTDLYDSVQEDMVMKMEDGIGDMAHGCDLHHFLCNQDYFIIGTYRAKQFIGSHAFEIIEKIKNYEQDNFGEVNTDLSQPENVANMFAYLVGEELLSECNTLQDCWDREMTEEEHKEILQELASVNVTSVYNHNN